MNIPMIPGMERGTIPKMLSFHPQRYSTAKNSHIKNTIRKGTTELLNRLDCLIQMHCDLSAINTIYARHNTIGASNCFGRIDHAKPDVLGFFLVNGVVSEESTR